MWAALVEMLRLFLIYLFLTMSPLEMFLYYFLLTDSGEEFQFILLKVIVYHTELF